jgi:hypothetical protein
MDYVLAKSGIFDQMTKNWAHVAIAATRHSASVFVDGVRVDDSEFDFPKSATRTNVAYPYPSKLHTPLRDFDLQGPISLGQPAFQGAETQSSFHGKIAMLKIYSSPLTDFEATCLFHESDQIMQSSDASKDDGRHRRLAAREAQAFSGSVARRVAWGTAQVRAHLEVGAHNAVRVV